MRKYTIFHVPILSFFSKALYRDVALNWKGTGFGYLFLLLAVCWIPAIVNMQKGLSRFAKSEAPAVISQIPAIRIVDGQASADVPQPHFIREPKEDKVIAVIDTTGTITSLDQTEALVLVTRTAGIMRNSKVETRTFQFAEIKNFTLDQAMLTTWMEAIRRFTVPVLYPLALLGSFSSRIVQTLIYALIGMLLAKWSRTRRPYLSLVRLSVVALTPPIIVETIVLAGGGRLPHAGWVYFVAAMAYLFFGIRAAREETPASAPQPPAIEI